MMINGVDYSPEAIKARMEGTPEDAEDTPPAPDSLDFASKQDNQYFVGFDGTRDMLQDAAQQIPEARSDEQTGGVSIPDGSGWVHVAARGSGKAFAITASRSEELEGNRSEPEQLLKNEKLTPRSVRRALRFAVTGSL